MESFSQLWSMVLTAASSSIVLMGAWAWWQYHNYSKQQSSFEKIHTRLTSIEAKLTEFQNQTSISLSLPSAGDTGSVAVTARTPEEAQRLVNQYHQKLTVTESKPTGQEYMR